MKRVLLVSLGILFTAFVVIQFFQPEKNKAPVGADDFFAVTPGIPDDIREMITYSCYDCHSGHTNYPWYGRIAPVSWLLASHIREGKDQLNLSVWGTLSDRKKIGALQDMAEVVENGEMPLKGYAALHRDARLSPEQVSRLTGWIETESLRLLGD